MLVGSPFHSVALGIELRSPGLLYPLSHFADPIY